VARFLGLIWFRFGLAIAAAVLMTVAALAITVGLYGGAGGSGGNAWLSDEKLPLLGSLALCLPLGLALGFWLSRALTLPLRSMAEAAQRIAEGDLSVRAQPGGERGEMADMVRHFNAMTDALARLERDRKATAAAISHELRTPLTILCARLHAASDGVIELDNGACRGLLDQAEHLNRLVSDLHTLSLADAGRLSLRLAPLDLVELTRDTLQRHALRLTQHGIEAQVNTPLSSAWVDADEDRLRQVLTNLIENATRHAGSGGWLELGVHPAPGLAQALLLTVSDAGPGLPDHMRQQLTRRFGDPGHPRAPAPGGSGLGLSIVQMLVQQHGGSIAVQTSARGGVRFEIRLPLAASTGPPSNLQAGASLGPSNAVA
jgi:signal transduction histidine kinase